MIILTKLIESAKSAFGESGYAGLGALRQAANRQPGALRLKPACPEIESYRGGGKRFGCMHKAVTKAVGDPRYYEIHAEDGQIVLTPVRIRRADAVRAKLAELEISEKDVEAAVTRARSAGNPR